MTYRRIALLAALVCLPVASLAGPPAEGYEPLGKIAPRHAREIEASNWSIGAETMGRDYTVYACWREYLGPLGVKKARIQSGWAKTEQVKGKYDWAWLDEIIPDMVKQGVEPWVCLCYGNPIYPGGGSTNLGGGMPSSKEALAAWDRFVAAFVTRYKQHVDEWEVWNEPGLRRKGLTEQYGDFIIRTAEIIRRIQPKAKILTMSTPGVGTGFSKSVLEYLKGKDKLHLVDEVTYHPYKANPDHSYGAVAGLRKMVKSYGGHIGIRQGENGCPSAKGSFGALRGHEWSETTQAKWALRRLLGDLGRDIPSSYFAICEMAYLVNKSGRDLGLAGKGKATVRINSKGLLKINPDKTVHHAKKGYYAVQHLAAVFDNTLTRVADAEPDAKGGRSLQVFVYTKEDGKRVAALWDGKNTPADEYEPASVTVTFRGGDFAQPVYADLLTGEVWSIPAGNAERKGDAWTFRAVPVPDYPVLIAARGAIGKLTTK